MPAEYAGPVQVFVDGVRVDFSPAAEAMGRFGRSMAAAFESAALAAGDFLSEALGIRAVIREAEREARERWQARVLADLDAERAAQPDREAALRARLAAWRIQPLLTPSLASL